MDVAELHCQSPMTSYFRGVVNLRPSLFGTPCYILTILFHYSPIKCMRLMTRFYGMCIYMCMWVREGVGTFELKWFTVLLASYDSSSLHSGGDWVWPNKLHCQWRPWDCDIDCAKDGRKWDLCHRGYHYLHCQCWRYAHMSIQLSFLHLHVNLLFSPISPQLLSFSPSHLTSLPHPTLPSHLPPFHSQTPLPL